MQNRNNYSGLERKPPTANFTHLITIFPLYTKKECLFWYVGNRKKLTKASSQQQKKQASATNCATGVRGLSYMPAVEPMAGTTGFIAMRKAAGQHFPVIAALLYFRLSELKTLIKPHAEKVGNNSLIWKNITGNI